AQGRAAGAPVILIQHEEDDDAWRFGAAGWQLADALQVSPDDLRVRKTTPDAFHQTALERLLLERGVTKLVICGLQSEFCVDSTVRRALALGYEVVLVADAHTTVDNGVLSAAQITAHHNMTFARMSSFANRAAVTLAANVRIGA
ncbi:isochorismatase family protein, partial [Pseudomonas sp. CrR25]|nr:isochorismatase family protein [Pseudomonas sp. CrR25]